jgi:hypothetical protein
LHKGVERYIILGADGAVLRSYPQVSGLCCFSMLQLDRPNETSRGQRKGSKKFTKSNTIDWDVWFVVRNSHHLFF